MTWIKYQYVCNILNEGAENERVILLDKKIGYNEVNLVIAQKEAYNGEYTIEDDEEDVDIKPLSIESGGTNAKTVEEARQNLSVYSKTEVDTKLMPTFTIAAADSLNYNKFARAIFPEIGTSTSVTKSKRIKLIFTNEISSNIGIQITAPSVSDASFASSTLYIKEAELDVAWCGMDGSGPEKYSLLFTLIFYGCIYRCRIAFGDNDQPVTSLSGSLKFTKVTSLS